MYRLILLTVTITSVVLQSYAASTSKPGPVTSVSSRFLRIQDSDDYKDTIGEAAEDLDTKDLDQLGSLAYAFRYQFREAIEELALQALTYLKSIFNELKVKLLKSIGKYTLSDLFHATFDGVTDFVKNASVDKDIPVDVEEDHARPTYEYGHYPYFHNPYVMPSGSG